MYIAQVTRLQCVRAVRALNARLPRENQGGGPVRDMEIDAKKSECRSYSDRVPGRLRLEFRPVNGQIPSARNAPTHSDAQIAETAGSVRAFWLRQSDPCRRAG